MKSPSPSSSWCGGAESFVSPFKDDIIGNDCNNEEVPIAAANDMSTRTNANEKGPAAMIKSNTFVEIASVAYSHEVETASSMVDQQVHPMYSFDKSHDSDNETAGTISEDDSSSDESTIEFSSLTLAQRYALSVARNPMKHFWVAITISLVITVIVVMFGDLVSPYTNTYLPQSNINIPLFISSIIKHIQNLEDYPGWQLGMDDTRDNDCK